MNLCSDNNCCGCGLCASICPKKAIKLKENEDGFIYPYIDDDKCINCGLCKKSCIYQKVLSSDEELKIPIKCYAAQNKNKEEEKKSASGGVFYAIAKKVIENDGYVCGAIMDINSNKVSVHHILSNKIDDIKKMQGSKYVQSNIKNIINEVDNKIKNNNIVLFCGTPCQTAAIRQRVGDNDKLFLIDIICHGVPSQKMFNDYLKLKIKDRDKLCEFIFRDKTKKRAKALSYSYSYIHNGKRKSVYRPAHLESYYELFLESLIYRNNCYNCPFAKEKRVSDITIGDYWGIEKYHSKEELEDKDIGKMRAWSCILVNTKKGEEMIKKYADNLNLLSTKLEDIKRGNSQLNKPSSCDENIRKKYISTYNKKGYKYVDKIYKNNVGKLKYIILLMRYKIFKY